MSIISYFFKLEETFYSNEIINCISKISKTFGGINLEDIAAPDCFIIEEKLKQLVDIPIFHYDQHGTAIITTAGLINALDIAKKDIKKVKIVVNATNCRAINGSVALKSHNPPAPSDIANICTNGIKRLFILIRYVIKN